MANLKAQQIQDQIELLERETSMSLAITDPKKYKDNNKKLDKLRKKFVSACW